MTQHEKWKPLLVAGTTLAILFLARGSSASAPAAANPPLTCVNPTATQVTQRFPEDGPWWSLWLLPGRGSWTRAGTAYNDIALKDGETLGWHAAQAAVRSSLIFGTGART